MALTQVTGPYPIFTDLDGSPLDDGYLYIGDANQDPETNPIQVFWDSALTIPATQPIRTNNGYAWRNGTPGLLYTAGEFSITIRNKRNEFVLYSPLGYGFDPKAVSAAIVKNDFIGNGIQTNFTLSSAPSTILATNIFINGVYQEKDSYNLIGNVILFTVAPPLGSSIEILTNETGVINGGNANDITYTLTEPGAVLQSVQSKLEQYVSVKDFGALGDGVTDDTAAIQAAIDASNYVFLPEGIYAVDGLVLSGDTTLYGAGRQSSTLLVTATAPTYGISIDGERNTFRNLRVQGAGANLIETVGGAFYASFEDVWFGECAIAFNIAHASYWSRFINCVFRECDKGVVSSVAATMNAVQFIGCATFYATPTAGNFAVEIDTSDGVSFVACDIQNQGISLTNCSDVLISGGYWEGYTEPVIKLVGGSATIQGLHTPGATVFDVDAAAASAMKGDGIPSNLYYSVRPTISQPINIFPDPTASTSAAVNALAYSSTGVFFNTSINGSGNLEITSTNVLARSGFQIPFTTSEGISIYVRWRVLAGTVKLQLFNTVTTSQDISTFGDGWQVTRMASPSSGSGPALIFGTDGAGPTWTAEISDIYVAPSIDLFADPKGSVKSLSGAVEQGLGYSSRVVGFEPTVTASTGIVDVTLTRFTGILIVKNALVGNANNVFTASMFFVQLTFNNNFIATSISSDDGPTGGCTFTVTSPSSGVVRITNTHAADTEVAYQFIGLNV